MPRQSVFPMRIAIAALVSALPCAAQANDDDLEFWFNPTLAVALDDDTSVKLETAQRLRRASQGRPDTYFFRLWARQKVSDELVLAGAVERRINAGRRDEVRTMQQVSGSYGIARLRMRLEQRFAQDTGGRMGLRLRSRIGIALPLDKSGTWIFTPDIESFITFRNSNPPGDIGKTEARAQLAVAHRPSDNLTVKLGYLLQYDLEHRNVDTIGHAPIVGLHFSF